jgi:hypothetical protein
MSGRGARRAIRRRAPAKENCAMCAFLLKAAVLAAATWALTVLPSPTQAVPLPLKNVLVVAAAIIAAGMMLYDTLFHDRYQP